jgi:hypothetical protein
MRYYYHIRVGEDRIEDEEGSEHSSVEDAVNEAKEAARQILSQDARVGIKLDERKFEVHDEGGCVAFELVFTDVLT